ncbi:TPA: restriction endonuclease subunit S [Salmonella enterica]|nr:restriction endonuclease subunit S [Salmonella enterica]
MSVKCSQRVPDENEQFIYVDIGSINREIKVIENPQHLIGKDAPSRARKEIKAHDIIVSLTRPNLNAVALVSEKYDEQIASTGFEVIRPALVESRYIFALVRSRHFINSISGLVQGALYPAAKSSDVQSYEFPLPPLAEQKIIAEKLDTLLAQVDNTKARLEQIPQILKRFRQAVLAMALNGSSEQSRNPTKIVKLIDVTKKITDGEHLTPKTINSGIPLLSAKDVQEDELLFDNVKYLSDIVAAKALNRCNPEKNDILIVSRGATVGRTHLVSTSKTFCLMGSVLLIKLDTEQVVPEYMKLIFNDISGQQQLVSASGATAQQAIYIRDVKEFSFKLISLHEQHEIVRRVEQLFAYADTIEKQVNNTLIRVNSLTQSILAKAFRGELTAQWRAENPDLISGENSAAALLEKIRAERAASGGKKTSRKKA